MKIQFMKYRWYSIIGSLLVLLGTLLVTEYHFGGFNKGIDFAGGIKIEVAVNEKITADTLRAFFSQKNIPAQVFATDKDQRNTIKIEIGGQTEVLLTAEAEKNKADLEARGFAVNSVDYLRAMLIDSLANKKESDVQFINADHVGPTIGKYLTVAAVKVLSVALILITIYVAFRFRLNFAVGALFASIHDLVITFGVIGVLQIPLSVPVVAALLTILGYSINDTIVIFDRIRENLQGQEELGIDKVVDRSIVQSMTRTINTTTTTILAILPVYFLGGEGLRDLALVLIIGILIGTYSSNLIAAPVVVIWDNIVKRRRFKRA